MISTPGPGPATAAATKAAMAGLPGSGRHAGNRANAPGPAEARRAAGRRAKMAGPGLPSDHTNAVPVTYERKRGAPRQTLALARGYCSCAQPPKALPFRPDSIRPGPGSG
jgi:hypothetical protein